MHDSINKQKSDVSQKSKYSGKAKMEEEKRNNNALHDIIRNYCYKIINKFEDIVTPRGQKFANLEQFKKVFLSYS